MSPLFRELLAAHKTARQPDLYRALIACELQQAGGPVWGVAFVSVDSHHYAPSPGGKPAIIVPAFADGALVDLVACGLETRAIRTRYGAVTVLGEEWLDHARETGEAARMFPDPIEWLRNGRRGAVLLDQRAACFALADVPAVNWCGSETAAQQIDRAMRRPINLPQIFIREETANAAA